MTSNPNQQFQQQVAANVKALGMDADVTALSRVWSQLTNRHGYTYNFSWMGRPIIQYPQDMVAMQELIWSIKPDLIIETGIAHGGSLVFSASMLALLDLSEAIESGTPMDPRQSHRKVVGVDIDIRAHNRAAIECHPMSSRIQLIQGSSVDPTVVSQVHEKAANHQRVLVCLDSNHTHEHVLAELEAYAPLVTPGSYCIVYDTLVEDMPEDSFPDRPWGKGNNPKTAVWEYLKTHPEFEVDRSIPHKLQITVAPDGFLRRLDSPVA
jgi:cephalosporin hydroxylase